MKKLFIAATVVAFGALASCNTTIGTNPTVKTTKDSLSYCIGTQFGTMLKQASIPSDDLDLKVVIESMNSIIAGDTSKLTAQQTQEIMTNYFTVVLPKRVKENSAKEFEKILKENPKAVKAENGLVYEIIEEGDLSMKPELQDTATLHYTGTLMDGTKFDSSVDRGEPLKFAPLQNSIAGFNQGVSLIGPGGKIKIWIPSELGYGAQGQGPIPANADLIFDVELISVSKAAAAPAETK